MDEPQSKELRSKEYMLDNFIYIKFKNLKTTIRDFRSLEGGYP